MHYEAVTISAMNLIVTSKHFLLPPEFVTITLQKRLMSSTRLANV